MITKPKTDGKGNPEIIAAKKINGGKERKLFL
jgi:hypothetical protein